MPNIRGSFSIKFRSLGFCLSPPLGIDSESGVGKFGVAPIGSVAHGEHGVVIARLIVEGIEVTNRPEVLDHVVCLDLIDRSVKGLIIISREYKVDVSLYHDIDIVGTVIQRPSTPISSEYRQVLDLVIADIHRIEIALLGGILGERLGYLFDKILRCFLAGDLTFVSLADPAPVLKVVGGRSLLMADPDNGRFLPSSNFWVEFRVIFGFPAVKGDIGFGCACLLCQRGEKHDIILPGNFEDDPLVLREFVRKSVDFLVDLIDHRGLPRSRTLANWLKNNRRKRMSRPCRTALIDCGGCRRNQCAHGTGAVLVIIGNDTVTRNTPIKLCNCLTQRDSLLIGVDQIL